MQETKNGHITNENAFMMCPTFYLSAFAFAVLMEDIKSFLIFPQLLFDFSFFVEMRFALEMVMALRAYHLEMKRNAFLEMHEVHE